MPERRGLANAALALSGIGVALLALAVLQGAPVTMLMADREDFVAAKRFFQVGAAASGAGLFSGLVAWGSRDEAAHRRGRTALVLSALTLLVCGGLWVVYRR